MRNIAKLKPGQGSASSVPGPREAYLMNNMDSAHFKEYTTWRPFRLVALSASFFASTFAIVSICTHNWLTGTGFSMGIWTTCYFDVYDNRTGECPVDKAYWQNAVIGLMVFAVGFGFLATILSICGLCSGSLPKKIYYYHSAGEIFLICALSCCSALIIYPVAIEVEDRMGAYSFGYSYGLGWGASCFYLTAALCMCLDDLIRTFSKGCCFKSRDDGSASRL